MYLQSLTLVGLYKRYFADMQQILGPPPHEMSATAGTALPLWAIRDTISNECVGLRQERLGSRNKGSTAQPAARVSTETARGGPGGPAAHRAAAPA